MPDIATLRAAKFWVAMAGTVLSGFLASWPSAPQWVFVLSALLTSVAVYLVPNEESDDE